MPAPADDIPTSWADQVELGEDDDLPTPLEEYDESGGLRTITEFKFNDEGKKVKVVKTYKVEVRKVSKSIARRKAWRKFGNAENDPPGPNPSNTVISEDVFMVFINTKENMQSGETDEDALAKLKGQKIVTCRVCKGDHWTTKCPYKDTLSPLDNMPEENAAETEDGKPAAPGAASKTGKYVPPSLRGGAGKGRGESMANKRDETATIRVTNLPEETRESDLQDLFRSFGAISRIYLAKDKVTGDSKGFAFINFHKKEDAARAIVGISGYGYNHLILSVEWAKPSGHP